MLQLLPVVMQIAVGSAMADSTRLMHKTGGVPPTMQAVRTSRAPAIDGALNEVQWAAAPAATDFAQMTPKQGEPASERTEVRILYDDNALYVAARMFERDRSKIHSLVTRRDGAEDADFIAIVLDSYHDHQTAFAFAVNPDGVRLDGIGANDGGPNDLSWDPVWEAAAQRTAEGWTAEMRIPLSQLRFSRAAEQLWGIQIFRKLFSRGEEVTFAAWKQNENGYASRFGHLIGISSVPSPKRLEIMPYARGQVNSRRAQPGDPFFDGTEATQAFGLDLKYGITSNLTFDATINPDFGQVESDPAELNLGVFETFQQERRPFFLEGSQIFDFSAGCNNFCFNSTPQLFYSRRIGRAPELSPREVQLPATALFQRGPFYDVPANTPILGAAKLSGKLGNGISLGVLHAETGEAFGRAFAQFVVDPGLGNTVKYRDVLEPRARYSVGRLRQDLRGGATTFGMLATNVSRDIGSPRLEDAFHSGATTVGLDMRHRWMKNRFNIDGHVATSNVRGSRNVIADAQQSSARYFQRPDQDYVDFDTTRTSLTGTSGHVAMSYRGPSGLIVSTTLEQVSPEFEVNDFGYLASADNRGLTSRLGWSLPKPTKKLRYQGADLVLNRVWNYGRTPLSTIVGLGSFAGFQSGWDVSGFLFRGLGGFSQTATRGGPLTATLPFNHVELNASSDARRKVRVSGYSYYRQDSQGEAQGNLGGNVTFKPLSNFQLSLGPRFSGNNQFASYVRRQTDETYATDTYGTRYVFATLKQQSFSLTSRASYTFSPAVSLQLYLESFTSSANYSNFKQLRRARSSDYLEYGSDDGSTIAAVDDPDACDSDGVPAGETPCYTVDPDGGGAAPSFTFRNPDRSFQSLRSTSVFRWEYHPGATFFVVWTQNRGLSRNYADFGGPSDIPGLFGLPLENVFLVKINYWFSR